jgi:hypothetical protein
LGDADGIPHVIAVAMSDQYVVYIDVVSRYGSKSTTGEKGIDQDSTPFNVEAESGMPIPC